MRKRIGIVKENLERAEKENEIVVTQLTEIKSRLDNRKTSWKVCFLFFLFFLFCLLVIFLLNGHVVFKILFFVLTLTVFWVMTFSEGQGTSLVERNQEKIKENMENIKTLQEEFQQIQERERNSIYHEIIKGKGATYYQKNLSAVFLSLQDEDWEPYGGYTKSEVRKEIREIGGEEYKYMPVYTNDVKLVCEPTNSHDPNAVQIFVCDKLVGYIPKRLAIKISAWVGSPDFFSYTCRAELDGGEYIGWDYGNNKIFTSEKLVKVVLDLNIVRIK